ncbi:MAG: PAS domain S-box protein [Pirellulales bacterium]
MPSAKRPRHREQIAALRQRIAKLESELTESRQFDVSLRRVDGFFGRQFGTDRNTLVVFSGDLGRVRFVGQCVEGVLGCTEVELQADATAWMRSVVPDDLAMLYQAVAAAADGHPAEVTYRVFEHESLRWIRARFAVNADSEQADCVVGFFGDVTQLKVSQESIRTSEERLWLLTSSAPIGIFMSDAAGHVIYVNPRLQEIYGYSASELFELGFMRIFLPHDRQGIREHWLSIAATTANHDTERTIVDGHGRRRWIHVRSVPLVSDAGELLGRIGTVEDITERKEAEAALRASEERFRLLSDRAPIGIFVADPVGRFLYANPRLQRVSGLPERELLDTNFSQVFPADQSQKILADWLRVAPTLHQQYVVQQIVGPSGEDRWVGIRSSPFVSPTGIVLGRIGTVEDITDWRVAEQELRESEARYRMLAEHATDIISTHGRDAVCRYVSPACRAVLGFEPEELVGSHPTEFVHPDDWASVVAASGPTGSPFMTSTLTYRCRHKDGHYVWLETLWKAIPSAMREEHSASIVALSRDITVRRQAAERLQASEARLRAILDTASDGIITIDESGTIEQFNPGAERLFGYRADEVLGQSIDGLLIDAGDANHRQRARRPSVFRRPLARTRGIVGRRKDGSQCELEISVGEAVIAGRSVFTGILHDVSERIRTERRMRENEKLAATGRIAARVAHEINNPLAGIKNSFLLLRDSIPSSDPYYHYVTRIETEIDRIARIVRRMFDLHRPSHVTLERIDPSTTLRDLVVLLSPIAKQHDVTLELCAKDVARTGKLSEDSFRQVVYSVIVNAIEASPPGGTVRIVARSVPDGIDVFVSDEGPGIPAQIQHQVYEPFFTTKSQLSTGGLGLGLSIARGIVEAMCGTLEFQSQAGQGTVFHIHVPVVNREGDASYESNAADPVC